MIAAAAIRKVMAVSFPLGALGHFWWVGQHGLLYHGPAPPWAVWFWYGLCAVDFVICLLLLIRPRTGLVMAVATMAVSLWVNWTCFPTFEHGFNWVLVGLTMFGVWVFFAAPWLWRALSPAPLARGGAAIGAHSTDPRVRSKRLE